MIPVNFDDIKKVLTPAMRGGAGTIKREIKSGQSFTYKTDNGRVFAVVRPEGKELVFVAVAGSGLALVANEFIFFAKSRGYKSIRYHTRNPKFLQKGVNALAVKPRLIEVRRALLGADEYIYRINIT